MTLASIVDHGTFTTMRPCIRHIVSSYTGDLFATGEFEQKVTLWSFKKRRELVTLDTALDFGGRRLAVLGGEDPLVIAGAYSVHGLAAYSIQDAGVMVWRRRDLKKVQYLHLDEQAGTLAVGIEGKPLHLLDARTGETLDTLRGAHQGWFGPGAGQMIVEGSFGLGLMWQRSEGEGWERAILCAAGALDVASGNDQVVACVSGEHEFRFDDISNSLQTVYATPATLRCWDQGCRMQWAAQAQNGSHFLRVAWCERGRIWYAIEWAFERGGPHILKAFNETGAILLEQPIGGLGEAEFTGNGEYLVTSNGQVLSLPSLEIAWYFADIEPLPGS